MAKAKSKPRKARLKVFRTPIGFHDAYVAAPSRKAALEAWGSATDLFGAGAAEVVTDPKLTKVALAHPGEVIRTLRGSVHEQLRALGKVKKRKNNRPSPRPSPAGGRRRKPSRAAVEKAEQAVEQAKARHDEAAAKLQAEERALQGARERFRAAMEKWAGQKSSSSRSPI